MKHNQTAADMQAVRRLVTGYQAAMALLTADELGLVEALRDGPMSADQLSQALSTDRRATRRFLTALEETGVVERNERGAYLPGPLAAGLRDAARIGMESYRAWTELPYTLRTGRPAFPKVFGRSFYDYLGEDEERATRFDSALAAVSRDWAPAALNAYDFSRFGTVVDVGGGRGTFLSILLSAFPHMRGILFDQPDVVAQSGPILQEAGVAGRCEAVGGSFFDGIPGGGDAYALCNLLTDWPDEEATAILANIADVLPEDGRILVIDRVLPPEGHPNRMAMAFLDLFFLVLEGGEIRSEDAFARILNAAGLKICSVTSTESTFSVIEARRA